MEEDPAIETLECERYANDIKPKKNEKNIQLPAVSISKPKMFKRAWPSTRRGPVFGGNSSNQPHKQKGRSTSKFEENKVKEQQGTQTVKKEKETDNNCVVMDAFNDTNLNHKNKPYNNINFDNDNSGKKLNLSWDNEKSGWKSNTNRYSKMDITRDLISLERLKKIQEPQEASHNDKLKLEVVQSSLGSLCLALGVTPWLPNSWKEKMKIKGAHNLSSSVQFVDKKELIDIQEQQLTESQHIGKSVKGICRRPFLAVPIDLSAMSSGESKVGYNDLNCDLDQPEVTVQTPSLDGNIASHEATNSTCDNGFRQNSYHQRSLTHQNHWDNDESDNYSPSPGLIVVIDNGDGERGRDYDGDGNYIMSTSNATNNKSGPKDDKNGVNDIISAFVDSSSLPGIQFIRSSKRCSTRMCWVIVMMFMLFFLTQHLYFLVESFTSYPKFTEVSWFADWLHLYNSLLLPR